MVGHWAWLLAHIVGSAPASALLWSEYILMRGVINCIEYVYVLALSGFIFNGVAWLVASVVEIWLGELVLV